MSVFRVRWNVVVVAALQSIHAQSSRMVLGCGVTAIGHLAFGNAANQAQFGQLGACGGERVPGLSNSFVFLFVFVFVTNLHIVDSSSPYASYILIIFRQWL